MPGEGEDLYQDSRHHWARLRTADVFDTSGLGPSGALDHVGFVAELLGISDVTPISAAASEKINAVVWLGHPR